MTIKVNLLPTERKRFTFDPLVAVLFVCVCAALVGCIVWGSRLQQDVDATQAKIQRLDDEIKKTEQSLPVIDEIKTQIAKLKGEIKVITSLKYDPVRYANLLTEVGKVLPENVWLTSLSVEPSTTAVTMSGVAVPRPGKPPLATVAEFIQKMDNSKIFTESSLSSTSQTRVDNSGVGFTFQIEARYDADTAAGLAEQQTAGASKDVSSSETES
ncbi:MAG: PilN domain-containing protein [Candidatus Bruticola sp.]